jgi:Tol biopolymer transport system component
MKNVNHPITQFFNPLFANLAKLGIALFFLFTIGCTTMQSPEPTATPLPPTATPVPVPSPTPAISPTPYPFSELPGWIAYADFACDGRCSNLSITRPDLSDYLILTDHTEGFVLEVHWSPDARYIAYGYWLGDENNTYQLRLYDLVKAEITILTPDGIQPVSGVSWSPDSRALIVGNSDETGTTSFITRIDIESLEITNLTEDQGFQDVNPAYSPDGTKIVFASNRPGGEAAPFNIWIMDADGSNPVNLTASDSEGWQNFYPAWSPTGIWIAFYRYTDEIEKNGLWLMQADGSAQELALDLQQQAFGPPVWSPDGRHIAIIVGDEESTNVLSLQFPSAGVITLNPSIGKFYGVSWAPDSQAVIYMQRTGDDSRVLHLEIVQEQGIYHSESQMPIDYAAWSPVDELP